MAEPRRRAGANKGDLKGARILIVESRFYDDISEELLKGATRVLDEVGAKYDRITVPGSLEIPAAIAIAVDAAQRKRRPYDGVVALGCVIRGDTIHFEIVSQLSRGYRLMPGDLIFTGTPAGVGPLQRGDKIDASLQDIGTLSVEIV